VSSGQAIVDELLDALSAALRARISDLSRGEARRASFVFAETSPARGPARPSEVAWEIHLARALHAATEPAALDLLSGLRHEARTIDEIALTVHPRGDRLAAAAWIGDLAAARLVGRDLETDIVSLAPLGAAIVELVESVVAGAAGR